MKVKCESKLWLYFAEIVFVVMAITMSGMTVLAYWLYKTGYFTHFASRPLIPFFILVILSVLIGTVLSVFVGKKILDPVSQLSSLSQEVAKGNFEVCLPENQRIKEIREMYHNFNRMVQELKNIETIQNDFVVNVSHEFKTPIAAIEGYATLLRATDISPEEHEEYTKMIIESVRQLATLSGNILKLSRLENQENIFDKEHYRIDEQIRQALLLLESEWSKKDLVLDIELPKVDYYGNKELMMQVWMNLLENAIKFSNKEGIIQVGLLELEGRVQITIKDFGLGMSENVQKHIFEKFYQGDHSRKTGGNGLGLALAKKIIDLSEGTVIVTSEPDQGSCFVVELPMKIK